jgi:hypothetical protein
VVDAVRSERSTSTEGTTVTLSTGREPRALATLEGSQCRWPDGSSACHVRAQRVRRIASVSMPARSSLPPGSAAPRAGDNDRARWHAAMVGRAPLLVAPSTRGTRRSSIGRHPGVRQIVLAGMCMLPWTGECLDCW